MPIYEIVFYLFSAVMLASAVAVITARNPVYSALFLVLTFFSASAIWMLLEVEFLAIILVLLYLTFGHLGQALLVMGSLPFALVGGAWWGGLEPLRQEVREASRVRQWGVARERVERCEYLSQHDDGEDRGEYRHQVDVNTGFRRADQIDSAQEKELRQAGWEYRHDHRERPAV